MLQGNYCERGVREGGSQLALPIEVKLLHSYSYSTILLTAECSCFVKYRSL
jgi:hypothetical protein